MSSQGSPLGAPAQIAGTATTYYTSTNCRTRVDKATVCNTTVGAVTFTMYKIPVSGSASATNTIVSAHSVLAGETYTCPELVGHWLAPGDFIQALASAATSLSLEMSGVQVT